MRKRSKLIILAILILCVPTFLLTGCTSVTLFRAELHVGRGDFLGKYAHYDEAIAQYTIAIQIYPKDLNAYYNRASLYNYLGEYELAITDCNSLEAISPSNPNIFTNRALAYIGTQKYDLAIANASQAINLSPTGRHPSVLEAWPTQKPDSISLPSMIPAGPLSLTPSSPPLITPVAFLTPRWVNMIKPCRISIRRLS